MLVCKAEPQHPTCSAPRASTDSKVRKRGPSAAAAASEGFPHSSTTNPSGRTAAAAASPAWPPASAGSSLSSVAASCTTSPLLSLQREEAGVALSGCREQSACRQSSTRGQYSQGSNAASGPCQRTPLLPLTCAAECIAAPPGCCWCRAPAMIKQAVEAAVGRQWVGSGQACSKRRRRKGQRRAHTVCLLAGRPSGPAVPCRARQCSIQCMAGQCSAEGQAPTASAAPHFITAWSATSQRPPFSLNSDTLSPLLQGEGRVGRCGVCVCQEGGGGGGRGGRKEAGQADNPHWQASRQQGQRRQAST